MSDRSSRCVCKMLFRMLSALFSVSPFFWASFQHADPVNSVMLHGKVMCVVLLLFEILKFVSIVLGAWSWCRAPGAPRILLRPQPLSQTLSILSFLLEARRLLPQEPSSWASTGVTGLLHMYCTKICVFIKLCYRMNIRMVSTEMG